MAIPNDDAQALAHCALFDLSARPRVGFRGAEAGDYLVERGYALPERPNQAVCQTDGAWVARLSATEYLLLGGAADGGQRVQAEEERWRLGPQACYLLPRRDSHAWLVLTGERAPAVMAKLCGVDLSPEAFGPGQIAQTSVARLDAMVINASLGDETRFHVLCDSASTTYLQPVLLDAMQEFDGRALEATALG